MNDKAIKKGTYVLGSAVPVTGFNQTYTSFSGVDASVYLVPDVDVQLILANPKGCMPFSGKYTPLGWVQAVTWEANFQGMGGEGKLITTVFDSSNIDSLPTSTTNILIHFSDEYANMGIVLLEEVLFRTVSGGISIDDLVSEEVFTFTFKKLNPLKKI